MPTTYPLDLTGVAPSNIVTNELHTFPTPSSRFFIPSAGPFFTIGLVVRHGVTNVLLQPDTQYKILHLHREASLASGKEVCAIIAIVDPVIPSVRISYQVIGGIYSDTASVIQDLLDSNPIEPSDTVSWQNILGAPVQFPPTEHLHHFDNIYGAEELVAVLERIRMAIAAGDSPAIAAIYQYIHTLLTNLNYATMNDVTDLIGGEPVRYIRTYKTFNDLRAEEFLINNESYLYVATGKETVNDKNGSVFMWDITSTLPDDDKYVIRPSIISTVHPGRFIACLRYADRNGDGSAVFENATPAIGTELGTHSVNIAMQNLAFQTLWNILYKYGIQSAIGGANTIPNGTDLHTVTTPGKYWFDDSHANRPFNWGILDVELVGGTIDSPSEVLHTARWDGRVATESRNSLGVWSEWHFIKNRDLGNEQPLSNIDLNTIVDDGNYACVNCSNSPETNGILIVKRETSAVVYQNFHSRVNTVYTRTTVDGVTWTDWREYADALTLSDAITNLEPLGGEDTLTLTGMGNIFILDAYKTIRMVLVGAGGGSGAGGSGSGGYGGSGTNGGDTIVKYTASPSPVIAIARGGLAGDGAYGGNSSSYALGSSGSGGKPDINYAGNVVVLDYKDGNVGTYSTDTAPIGSPLARALEITLTGQGKAGTHDGYYAIGGAAGAGAYIELLLINRSSSSISLTIDCNPPGTGGVGLNLDGTTINGQTGNAGVCVIFH